MSKWSYWGQNDPQNNQNYPNDYRCDGHGGRCWLRCSVTLPANSPRIHSHQNDHDDRGDFEDNHDIPIIMKMIITGDVIRKTAHCDDNFKEYHDIMMLLSMFWKWSWSLIKQPAFPIFLFSVILWIKLLIEINWSTTTTLRWVKCCKKFYKIRTKWREWLNSHLFGFS